MSKIKLTGNASGTGTLTIAAPNTNTDRTFNLPDEDGTVLTKTSGEDVSFYDATGTTAKFFWDASAERLGIGTSSPNRSLQVSGNGIQVANTGTTGASFNIVPAANGQDGAEMILSYYSGTGYGPLKFNVGNAERMRIDSSGNLLVGKITSDVTTVGVEASHDGRFSAVRDFVNTSNAVAYFDRNSYDGDIAQFRKNGTTVGSISVTGSATAYNTSSDYRLKTDVQPMTGATERLKALKPVNFAWKADGSRVDGFLAHELQEVIPEAATGTKDAMRTEEYEVTPAVLDDDGNVVTEAVMGTREVPDYQGIDQSKLVPLLVATVQEQQAVIESLTSRIEALENN